jgi:hypothetical protein
MKKEFCSQSDPPGEEVARKFLGAQKLKKYRIRSEQVNEFNGSKILPKCSHVDLNVLTVGLLVGRPSFILQVCPKAIDRIRSSDFSCPSALSNPTGVSAQRSTDSGRG